MIYRYLRDMRRPSRQGTQWTQQFSSLNQYLKNINWILIPCISMCWNKWNESSEKISGWSWFCVLPWLISNPDDTAKCKKLSCTIEQWFCEIRCNVLLCKGLGVGEFKQFLQAASSNHHQTWRVTPWGFSPPDLPTLTHTSSWFCGISVNRTQSRLH